MKKLFWTAALGLLGMNTYAQSHFTDCISNTGNYATVIFPEGLSYPFAAGDEVAALMPDGACAGVIVWAAAPQALTLWGDDTITAVVDGFQAGDTLAFRHFDGVAERDLAVTYDQSDPIYEADTFTANGLYVLASAEVVTPPDVAVTLTPLTVPLTIPPEGGTFDYDVSLVNHTAATQTTEVWVNIGGDGVSITLGPVPVTLAPGDTLLKTLTQNVPAGAPSGAYTVTGYAGSFPLMDDSDAFPFEKTVGKSAAGPAVTDWASTLDRLAVADASEESAAGADVPERFALSANYPNPFNPTTVLTYDLPEARAVTLTVYDVLGRRVARLDEGVRAAGRHRLRFDASHLSAGVYVYALEAGDFRAARRMVLLK